MAIAVLDRLRNADRGWALEVDLSRGPIRDSAGLADRIAEQARAAGVRIEGPDERGWGKRARRAFRAAGSQGLKAAAQLLDLPELAPIADIAAAVDQALAPVDEEADEVLDLRAVLLAIQAASAAEERLTVIFLDELQRVASDAHWSDPQDSHGAQTAIAELMEAPEGDVVVVLAGSDGEAMQRLLSEGQPLHHDGLNYAVPEISADDWRHGLRERFSELNIEIADEHIDRILDASGGHPQRTMRVCAHVHHLHGPAYDISEPLIDEAIKQARKHPSWPS